MSMYICSSEKGTYAKSAEIPDQKYDGYMLTKKKGVVLPNLYIRSLTADDVARAECQSQECLAKRTSYRHRRLK